jgi:hypothetical protein
MQDLARAVDWRKTRTEPASGNAKSRSGESESGTIFKAAPQKASRLTRLKASTRPAASPLSGSRGKMCRARGSASQPNNHSPNSHSTINIKCELTVGF